MFHQRSYNHISLLAALGINLLRFFIAISVIFLRTHLLFVGFPAELISRIQQHTSPVYLRPLKIQLEREEKDINATLLLLTLTI